MRHFAYASAPEIIIIMLIRECSNEGMRIFSPSTYNKLSSNHNIHLHADDDGEECNEMSDFSRQRAWKAEINGNNYRALRSASIFAALKTQSKLVAINEMYLLASRDTVFDRLRGWRWNEAVASKCVLAEILLFARRAINLSAKRHKSLLTEWK